MHLKGVHEAQKKDGSFYYRSSITYKNKHISLGSFPTKEIAHACYLKAYAILVEGKYKLADFSKMSPLTLEKWVVLMNYRDNGLYIKNPIYLHKTYFSYFLSKTYELKFDVDDLFYYSNHKIFRKTDTDQLGYLFVNDYGMQVNILNRYGIKNHGVLGKDYSFADEDETNLTRQNIIIHNPYYGVSQKTINHQTWFIASININGKYIIGKYKNPIDAAIAYNKAADYVKRHHISSKSYKLNYINDLNHEAYQKRYDKLTISDKILNLYRTTDYQ